MAERERQVPALVDLPLPKDCLHNEVEYWYTDIRYPNARGTARCVTLTKGARVVEFSLWIPVKFFVSGAAGSRLVKPDLADAQEATLLAYDQLTAAHRGLGVGQEVCLPVTLPDRRVLNVVMQHAWYRHVQEVWVDREGRVW